MKPSFSLFFILSLPLWLLPDQKSPFLSNWDLIFLWGSTLTLHEMAHHLTWRVLGYHPKCLCKWHGPVQQLSKRAYPLWHGMLAALVGPLTSFTIAWACQILVEPSAFQATWIEMNLLWGFWQLFPIRQLDGWVIVENGLEAAFGAKGVKFASFFSFVFCLLWAIILLLMSPILGFLPASFAILLAFHAMSEWQANWQLGSGDVEHKIQPILLEAMALHEQGHKMSAQLKLHELIEGPLQGRTITHARLLLAQWLLETGQSQKAWQLIKEIPNPERLSGNWLSAMHQVAYQSENFDKVRQLAAKSFLEKPECSIAVMNAIACARIHKEHFNKHAPALLKASDIEKMIYEVMGWLQAAERPRFREWDVLLSADFESLRGQVAFENFLKKHRQRS